MSVLDPIPDEHPNPDCNVCKGEGVVQSKAHQILGDDASRKACPSCWTEET